MFLRRMAMLEQQLDEEGSDLTLSRVRKPPGTFLERVYSLLFQKAPLAERKKNARLLELLRPTRYKPDTVEQLSRETQVGQPSPLSRPSELTSSNISSSPRRK